MPSAPSSGNARLSNLDDLPLPQGIRSRRVDNHNGLNVHVLEAGFERPGRPRLLLLHGFPELAWSWRKLMLPLAAVGFHVIAPDQRGYGRTTGGDDRYDGDVASFRLLNLVRDALGLLAALGVREVAAVVGHDFGSPVAAWCALVRPDVFRSVVLMSAPFAGPPALPFNTADAADAAVEAPAAPDVHAALATLTPPRKHYQWYHATREANDDMWHCPQGVHDFLRAYYHQKSADGSGNRPEPLPGWTAAALARLPTYYVMRQDQTMAQTVAPGMPSPVHIADCQWLPDDELRVYSAEFSRTGFQGGLQWYRCATSGLQTAELQTFSWRTIDVPTCFIAGASDWGVYQKPGDFEAMQRSACTQLVACHRVPGAGHWVQQEQPQAVLAHLLAFLGRA